MDFRRFVITHGGFGDTVCSGQIAVCSVQCTVFSVECTVFSVECSVCSRPAVVQKCALQVSPLYGTLGGQEQCGTGHTMHNGQLLYTCVK